MSDSIIDFNSCFKLVENLELLKAHKALKNIFDKLPFEILPIHTELIGLYVMVCIELNKKQDLNFLNRFLSKRISSQSSNSEIYLWAITTLTGRKLEYVDPLVQRLTRALHEPSQDPDLSARIVVLLIRIRNDCEHSPEMLIPLLDLPLKTKHPFSLLFIEIWRAILYRKMGRGAEALELISNLTENPHASNWYVSFILSEAKIHTLVEMGEFHSARLVLDVIKEQYSSSLLKEKAYRISLLKNKIENPFSQDILLCEKDEFNLNLGFRGKWLSLKSKSPQAKILTLLAREYQLTQKRNVNKCFISKKDNYVLEDEISRLQSTFKKSGFPDGLLEYSDGHLALKCRVDWNKVTGIHT